MLQESNAIASILKTRNSGLMFPPEVEVEYGIPQNTQAIWRCTNRYGWRDMTIKMGRRIAYRRTEIEEWLDSRRGLA